MSIQFNNKEEIACIEIIKEWYKKEGHELSSLRVTFELRATYGHKRFSVIETNRLVNTRLKRYKKIMKERELSNKKK